jgi:hypothetical protein
MTCSQLLTAAVIMMSIAVGVPTARADLVTKSKATHAWPSWWDTLAIAGLLESGITANPGNPSNGTNFGHLFTDKANRTLLNQAVLTIQRPVDSKSTGFDVGFKFQTLYGADARYTPFLGEFDYAIDRLNQLNIVEAYGIVHLPLLAPGGVDVMVGQYITLEGAETIYASDNLLYSHSYIFNFGIPGKHTGVMTRTYVSPVVELYAGIDSGVNTTLGKGDNNKTGAFHGGIGLNLMGGALTVLATTHIGAENANNAAIAMSCECNPNTALRYLNDLTAIWVVNNKFVLTTDLNYVRDDGFKVAGYGAAQYASYAINDWLKIIARAEIWRDVNGFFVAAFPGNFDFVNVLYGLPNTSYTGGATTYGALTLGLSITRQLDWIPYARTIIIRPEIRYDASLNNTTPYNNLTRSSQFTFGGDLIVPFVSK